MSESDASVLKCILVVLALCMTSIIASKDAKGEHVSFLQTFPISLILVLFAFLEFAR